MASLVVNLSISPEEFQRIYAGSATQVSTRSVDGRGVRFPGSILRQFVTREGIRGRFMIAFDQDNRFESISRI